MKYHFMRIEEDGTEITYSDADIYNNILVYLERYNNKSNHFDNMTIEIPSGKLINNNGYTEKEEVYHINKIKKLAKVIFLDYGDKLEETKDLEKE